jgi:hypothetical protein
MRIASYDKDFTEKNYKQILDLIKSKYDVLKFDEIKGEKRFVILRHDIDFSIHRARKLARFEKQKGLKACYFLWLGSFFYNVFEREIQALLMEIIDMGHDIGLHFDSANYGIHSEKDLTYWLNFEKRILETTLKVKIKTFSFHNPTDDTLQYNKDKYAGMINTYSRYFRNEVGYCSDSNGYWRYEKLVEILKKEKYEKLQILIHPGWWVDVPMAPKRRIRRCIEGRADKQLKLYDKMLKDHGRENIDEEV